MNAIAALLRLVAAALLGGAAPAHQAAPVATPIGRGPAFELSTGARADRGAPISGLRCTAAAGRWQDAHVEVFARGRVLILPPGIGVARPRHAVGATVTGGRCSYPVRTTDPTGVVRYRPGRALRLGDLFAVWGQPLGRHRVGGFGSKAEVRVYVGGRRVAGPPAAVPLGRRAEIVVEIGRYVPPHHFYVFAGGKAATA
ncbi:MAG TPA: hypothetical protein VHS27_01820 [Gaiellales bacterium]|jgi:hypothetical protein|nr:hypothetical protein [Gaiellales bacterium]